MSDEPDQPERHVQQALEAARTGDAVVMLTELRASRILDGLHHRIAEKYWRFSPEDVDTVIGRTLDDFLEAARAGKGVRRPHSWLFKVAMNHAFDYDAACGSERPTDPERVDRLRDGEDDPNDQATREERIQRAVRFARELVPLLGELNIQRVMSYLLDAIQAGEPDVTANDIAEALGMNPESVRSWMSRGFARLKQRAGERGIHLDPEVSAAEDNPGADGNDQ